MGSSPAHAQSIQGQGLDAQGSGKLILHHPDPAVSPVYSVVLNRKGNAGIALQHNFVTWFPICWACLTSKHIMSERWTWNASIWPAVMQVTIHRVIEWQNGLSWKGPCRSPSSTPLLKGRDTFHWLLNVPPNLDLNTSGMGHNPVSGASPTCVLGCLPERLGFLIWSPL